MTLKNSTRNPHKVQVSETHVRDFTGLMRRCLLEAGPEEPPCCSDEDGEGNTMPLEPVAPCFHQGPSGSKKTLLKITARQPKWMPSPVMPRKSFSEIAPVEILGQPIKCNLS
jgi:hypothetical protein